MWNDLTMKERADLIKQGVALGYKDIDAIRNNYHTFSKGSTVYTDSNPYYNRLPDSKKKEWRSLSARRQQFLKLMQQYAPQLYNDSQLRNVMEYIAFNEGRWGNTGVSKQGARGYFQLMPDTIATANRNTGRNYNINNPADDFAMTQITAQNSMKYIQKLWQNPEFRRKAEEKGYTPYDLLMSSWLAGPTGMKNNILKGTNPKDAYGTSIGAYVGNTDSQPGTNTMVINTGIEGKPVIITSTPEVEEAIRQNDINNSAVESLLPEPTKSIQEVQNEIQANIQQPQSNSNDDGQQKLDDIIALQNRYIEEQELLNQRNLELKEQQNRALQQQLQAREPSRLERLDNLKNYLYKQVENQLLRQAVQKRKNEENWQALGKYFNFQPEEDTYNPYSNNNIPAYNDSLSPQLSLQKGFAQGGSIHRFDKGDTVVTRPPLQAAQNQFAVPEYHYYDDWDPEQFYPTTKIGDAIYDNFDANAPAEPIQSYPNVGEVNPKYYNPTVKGEPVKILHRVQDNDQQAVAQYQDGELGIVNLPDNYWQRYLPEVVVPGRMQQLQGVIDQANEGKNIFEQQQEMEDAFRYQDEAERASQDSFYNPRAILDNTSRIPIIGALPTMSEYAYGMLKGGPEGQYWKDRASGAAEEQLLPIGLIAANSNPVTAAMADSALLGSSLYDIDRNGLNEENGIGLALGMIGPAVRTGSFISGQRPNSGIKVGRNGNTNLVFDENTVTWRKVPTGKGEPYTTFTNDAILKENVNKVAKTIKDPGIVQEVGAQLEQSGIGRTARRMGETVQKAQQSVQNTIDAYKQVVPKLVEQVKEYNGVNKAARTAKAALSIANPRYTKELAKYPEIQERMPLWGYSEFTPEKIRQWGEAWNKEAAKGLYAETPELETIIMTDPKRFPEIFKKARTKRVAEMNTTGPVQRDIYANTLDQVPLWSAYQKLKDTGRFTEYDTPIHYNFDSDGARSAALIGKTTPAPSTDLNYNYMIMNLKDRADDLNLKITQEDINKLHDAAYKDTEIAVDPLNTMHPFTPKGELNKSIDIGGWRNKLTDNRYQVIRPGNYDLAEGERTQIHEGVGHGTQYPIDGLTAGEAKREYSQLTDTLTQMEKDLSLDLRSQDSKKWTEARSTILELRDAYLQKIGKETGKPIDPNNITIKEKQQLREFVDNLSNDQIADHIGRISTYGYDYAQLIRYSREVAALVRHLITDGFAIGAPMGIVNSLSTDSKENKWPYKYGGTLKY